MLDKLFAKGRMVKGTGSGLSDLVPSMIMGNSKAAGTPALLSNEEYVLPAKLVSALGDGSSEAGARWLERFQKLVLAHSEAGNGKLKTKKMPPPEAMFNAK